MYKSTCVVVVEVVYPLKQGLKLMKNLILEYYIEGVEVVYPLKQGLKPDRHIIAFFSRLIC